MCSQDEIIAYLNESDDFDPQTFDNLFDEICAAKETYLPWKQHQKKKWLLTLWKRLLTFYQLVKTYPTQNFQCMRLWNTLLILKFTIHYTIKAMNTVPFYDFPQSPILIIGFFGIFFTLVLLYFVNRAYFESPLNRDRKSWIENPKMQLTMSINLSMVLTIKNICMRSIHLEPLHTIV